jgi:hypothetical protein
MSHLEIHHQNSLDSFNSYTMKQKTKAKVTLRVCSIIIFMLLSPKSYGVIVWRSLPKLVHEAPVIAKGKISIQDEKIILNVEKIMKGQDCNQITVLYHHWFEVPDPKFKDGEDVLLFLHTPAPNEDKLLFPNATTPKEGEMYLFGLGWHDPRKLYHC